MSDAVLSPNSPLHSGPWRLSESETVSSPGSPLPGSARPRWADLLAPVQPGVDGVQLVSQVTLHAGLQTQERCLILFPSTLIIAKYKSGGVKPKMAVRLCDMWTASCVGEVCEATVARPLSFVVGWPTTNHVVTFRSEEDRHSWFTELTRRIAAEKAKDEPKSIPLKILVRDIPTTAFAKTLCVGHTDTAQEVIAMALKQFAITGQASDFKLWVYSGKEETPYPLIGHEQPYSVRMWHVREAVSCLGPDVRVGHSSFPVDARLPDESLPPELRCHFVLRAVQLRRRRPALATAAAAARDEAGDPSGGNLKRKRSLMSWTIRRSFSRSDSDATLSPLSPVPSAGVFGVPLSLLCPDGTPPKSIMALLSAIFREGPFTRGIFRKSANMRHCRTLRERLCSGESVDWTQETPHVAAAVFKDFLRSLPGSLLCCELYPGWLESIADEDPHERLENIRRLLCRVPPCHHALLRSLLCVLHHVAALSSHNHMTAPNLARCIAPSLLWPSRGEQQRSDTLQVVELVEFLICHCQELLGDDVTAIFGPLPEPSNMDADNSDSSDASSLHQRDSLGDGAPGDPRCDNDCDSQLLSECLQALSFSRTAHSLFPAAARQPGAAPRSPSAGSPVDGVRSLENSDGCDGPEKTGRRGVAGNDHNGNVEYDDDGGDGDDVFRENRNATGPPPAIPDSPGSRASLARPASLRLRFPCRPGSSCDLSTGLSTSSQSSTESLQSPSTSPDSASRLDEAPPAPGETGERSLSVAGRALNLSFDSVSTFYRDEKAARPVAGELRRRLLKSSQSLSPGPLDPPRPPVFYRNRGPPSSARSVDSLHRGTAAADASRSGPSAGPAFAAAGGRRHALSAGALDSPERRGTPAADGPPARSQGVVGSLLSPLVNRSWFRTGSYTLKRAPGADKRRGAVVPRGASLFSRDCGILEPGAAGRDGGGGSSPSDSPRRAPGRGFVPDGLFFSGLRSPETDARPSRVEGGGGDRGGDGGCGQCRAGGSEADRGLHDCAGCAATRPTGPGDGAAPHHHHDAERRV